MEWKFIDQCARWMEPFFNVICEEAPNVSLLEQNGEVTTKFGLGHICPNIVTDDSHILQTHSINIDMLVSVFFSNYHDHLQLFSKSFFFVE